MSVDREFDISSKLQVMYQIKDIKILGNQILKGNWNYHIWSSNLREVSLDLNSFILDHINGSYDATYASLTASQKESVRLIDECLLTLISVSVDPKCLKKVLARVVSGSAGSSTLNGRTLWLICYELYGTLDVDGAVEQITKLHLPNTSGTLFYSGHTEDIDPRLPANALGLLLMLKLDKQDKLLEELGYRLGNDLGKVNLADCEEFINKRHSSLSDIVE